MIEHPADPADPSLSNVAQEERYYIPPGKPEPLTGRGKAPSVKRFNRKMLAVIAAVGGLVITLAFSVGLQKPKTKAQTLPESASKPPTPNEAVNALPGSYSDVVPVLGEPRPGDLGSGQANAQGLAATGSSAPHPMSPLEQYTQQLAIEHLRKEDAARSAGVAFSGSGAGETHAASSIADTGQDFQNRLLDIASRGTAAPGPAQPAYREEDPNGQEAKSQFAGKAREREFTLDARVEAPRSAFTLFAGTILPCVLTQGINSDLPGEIGCLVSQNVYDTVTGHYLLVPQGTKALGTYDSRVAYGQSRVLVVWTRLLRPDGSTLSLEGMPGTDLSGYAGLTGHVNNHYLRLLSGVVMGSLIGASAQIATGANSQNPSFAALAAQGAGQNINEAGQQITRKNLNIQPTIEVRPGSRLNIFTTKDLILPPWQESAL